MNSPRPTSRRRPVGPRRVTRVLAALTTLLTAAAVLAAPAVLPAPTALADDAAAAAQTVTADALPTVQVNGVVWDQEIVGDTVYAVGSFTTARPAGSPARTDEVPRANALAYRLSTGELLDWAPDVNGVVYAVEASEDGSRVFLGGAFTSVNGHNRYRVAAVTPTTGRTTGLSVGTNSTVRTMDVESGVLYLGGAFTQVNSQRRTRVAAVDVTTDAGSLTAMNPTVPSGTVNAVAARPGGAQLVLGGSFTSVNGSTRPGYGMAVVSTADGSLTSTPVNSVVRNAGTQGAITGLRADETGMYATAYSQQRSTANLEGAFKLAWDTGEVSWLSDCHGDEYDLAVDDSVVYVAGHSHSCVNVGGWEEKVPEVVRYAVAYSNAATGTVSTNTESGYSSFAGQPAPTVLTFFPTFTPGTMTSAEQSVWTVETDGRYVVYVGEFTNVNGQLQQGLVRFAPADTASNQQGPLLGGKDWPLTVSSPSSGTVHLTVGGNYDRDDDTLTYTVERDEAGTVVTARTVTVDWWALGTLSFEDTGQEPGSTHRYRVVVTDPDGNTTNTDWAGVTVLGTTGDDADPWLSRTRLDGATHLWRLDETRGTALADSLGSLRLTASNVSLGRTGALAQGGTSGAFATTTTGWLWPRPVSASACSASTNGAGTGTYSVETWIRTTAATGGVVAGFRSGSGTSTRAVYTLDDGRVAAHAQAGRTVTSTASYNDGAWHHVVVTVGGQGQVLYVDGSVVARDATTRVVAPAAGAWCAGTGALSGVSPAPSSASFTGDIDELAVYPTALDAATVARRASLGATGADPGLPGAPVEEPGPAPDTDEPTTGPTDEPTTEPGGEPAEPPVAQALAADSFSRDVTAGWGQADQGGTWTTAFGALALSVSGGVGHVSLAAAGSSARTVLGHGTAQDVTASTTVSLPALPQGGGVYLALQSRSNGADSYRTKLLVGTDGTVWLWLTSVVGATETVLATSPTTLKVEAGTPVHVTMACEGASPTTVSARVWVGGQTEPTGWTVSAQDSTASLQGEGTVGLFAYSSGRASAPVTLDVDDLAVTTP